MATKPSRRTRKIPRLVDAVIEGDRALKHTREQHHKTMAMHAGDHYSDDSTPTGMHMNVMNRSMVAMLSNLAGDDPECEVAPLDDPQFEGLAELSGKKITRDFKRVDARHTAELCLLDALCSFGTIKTGICPTDDSAELESGYADRGKWYMDRVSVDDVILDASARGWDERLFHGHRYRISRASGKASGLFDKQTLEKLPRSKDSKDDGWGAATRKIDRARAFDLVDYIDLIDCWVAPGVLGREAMSVTIPGGKEIEDSSEVLRIQEYVGPDHGPYLQLGFYDIPGKLIPSGPAQYWKRLAVMMNQLLAKIMDSDLRYKKGATADQSVTDDQITAFMNGDNEFFMRGNASMYGKVEVGGSSPAAWQNMMGYLSLFSQTALNAELLAAGGGTGDKTATEINELSQKLGQILGYLEEKYYGWWDCVCGHAFWWLQRDPLLNETITIEVVGEKIEVPMTAQTFEQLGDYVPKFRVRRGSMRRMDRTLKTQQTIQIVGTVVPLAANMAKMNPDFDQNAFITSMLKGVVDSAEIQKWWSGSGAAAGAQQLPAAERKAMMMPMAGGGMAGPVAGGPPVGPQVPQMQPAGVM